MAGNNGYGSRSSAATGPGKKRTAADIRAAAEEEERRAYGTPELRAALQPGRLLRLAKPAAIATPEGGYQMLVHETMKVAVPPIFRKGAFVMYVGVVRVELFVDGHTVRQPRHTFFSMGNPQRFIIVDMSLIEPC